MRIGVDAMGGDYAPLEAVKGASLAASSLAGVVLVLFGSRSAIEEVCIAEGININQFEIVDTPDVIEMAEHPVKALVSKPNSSIAQGFLHLAQHKVDAFLSAGNTGAMLVGSIQYLKLVDGCDRPCLTAAIPRVDDRPGLLLDVGANADCKPEHLEKFALLGNLLYSMMYKVESPKIGLLNIGEESEKGNLLTKATHQLLSQTQGIQFVGNVEGRDIFGDTADVVVCDGFSGNVIIKLCEGIYYRLVKRGVQDDYLDQFNFKHYGGSMVLGVNAPVIVGHGITKAETFVKMIELAQETVQSQLTSKIQKAMSRFIASQAETATQQP
ncbi:MAG: phosphate acyltransferase PlsX [Bacteroidia bacterium]|nr:phosphate acyltransferase PlsX [Bacteroidia bacterium]